MTSRERVGATITARAADCVPRDLWAEPEVFQSLRETFGVATDEQVRRALRIDMRWLVPEYIGPVKPERPDGSAEDYLGIGRRPVSYGKGIYWEISYYPLARAETPRDVRDYHWPDLSWWDYRGINEMIRDVDSAGEVWIGTGFGSYFERAWNMRGMENFLVDLLANPDMACSIMDRLHEFFMEHTERTLQAANGRIDMLYTADDIGAQHGQIISLDMWKKHIMPRQAAFNDYFKRKYGVKIFYHSCGGIAPLIPYLIDIGVDILNPLQFSADGMDPEKISREYGSRICFHGGIDVQTTLVNGSVEDVKEEVRDRLAVLGRDGGYILAPAHAIQVDTEVSKILAMYSVQ